MANREARTLSFTPEQAAFITMCVSSGRYQSASEVVREALRLLENQEAHRQAELDRVRALGADQLDRGEVVDANEVFRRLDEKHARLKNEMGSSESNPFLFHSRIGRPRGDRRLHDRTLRPKSSDQNIPAVSRDF